MNWLELRSEQDFQEAINRSLSENLKGIVVFKHSTRCGVSAFALKQFEATWDLPEGECPAYMIDLLAHRDVSNLTQQHFGIQHESPQVIVVKNGEAVYHASHQQINGKEVSEIIRS